MTNYQASDIVLVLFPFTDLVTLKKRPALVLHIVTPKKLPKLVILAMITSQLESENLPCDYILKNWEKSGLIYSSKVRLAKLVTVEEGIILEKLGSLERQEWKNIQKEFLKLFSF